MPIFIPTKSPRIATRSVARAALLSLLLGVVATPVLAQFRYDTEYPSIGYGKTPPTDAFSRVMELRAVDLKHDSLGRGYLDSVLEALDIDPASQILVFSKTSLKQRFITPENPRSLFFNDEVYVGFVPGSSTLEIGAMDPQLGPVFFDFEQDPAAPARFEQQTGRCLRCHDTYSMTGGGVPRFMLSSVYAGADGNLVSHELSEITDTATPIEKRWGGFYVTGTHGDQRHLGNFVIRDTSVLRDPAHAGVGNLATLDSLVALDKYVRNTSDIVALLVLEHQVEVQNRITRVSYDGRMQLEKGVLDMAALDALTRPLLDSLFMAHEAPLAAPVAGSTEYAENFVKRGPVDSQGRSLRDFDLQTRTFRYPLSYLIYSDAISALPATLRDYLFGRIKAVLENATDAPVYPHLATDQRAAIAQILRETKPEVLQ
ncbi:MAG: hypothetical protein RLZZ227_1700 [Pseudomonadota bacterium]|jgi:hypothetical protein